MGSLCSKASTQTGGHQVLSSEAANSAPVDPAARRAALAAAADSRKKKDQARGTLSSDTSAPFPKPTTASMEREEEPLRWD